MYVALWENVAFPSHSHPCKVTLVNSLTYNMDVWGLFLGRWVPSSFFHISLGKSDNKNKQVAKAISGETVSEEDGEVGECEWIPAPTASLG